MSQTIINVENFSVDNVQFSKILKNKRGGKQLFLNCGGKRFYVKLPELRAPFGLSKFEDENTGNVSYSLNLSLDGYDEEDHPNKDIFTRFKELDNRIIDHVLANSKELLGKEYTKEVLEALYKPMIRESTGDYAPTLKLKVPFYDDKFIPEAYNTDKELTDMTNIDKGSKCKTLIEIAMIWFIDNKFGPSVRLSQVMITPQASLKGCAFDNDDEDDFETFDDNM